MRHLETGRVVALLPSGPMADKRFAEVMAARENRSIKVHAEILLPPMTFSRAGTNVRTRIVVADKLPFRSEPSQQRPIVIICVQPPILTTYLIKLKPWICHRAKMRRRLPNLKSNGLINRMVGEEPYDKCVVNIGETRKSFLNAYGPCLT